jgi:hypothetical protein
MPNVLSIGHAAPLFISSIPLIAHRLLFFIEPVLITLESNIVQCSWSGGVACGKWPEGGGVGGTWKLNSLPLNIKQKYQ